MAERIVAAGADPAVWGQLGGRPLAGHLGASTCATPLMKEATPNSPIPARRISVRHA
ncbi:MAG: hypothetical protein ACTHN0_16035 [Aquihabitans sp.]